MIFTNDYLDQFEKDVMNEISQSQIGEGTSFHVNLRVKKEKARHMINSGFQLNKNYPKFFGGNRKYTLAGFKISYMYKFEEMGLNTLPDNNP